MQLRRTLIVLALFVLVGGYAWIMATRQITEETQKLFKIKADDITKVVLKFPDQEIELDKQSDGKWMLVKPIKTGADQTTVQNLVRAIADCEVKSTVDEHPTDLAPFGLAQPDVVVTVTTKDKGALPGIEIGRNTPIGFSAYIKTTDKPTVLLTNSAFPPGMKKKVADLRDRELVSFKVDDAHKITIERPDAESIELDKDHDRWTVVKPVNYAADATQVRQLLSAMTNAKVDEFIDDAPSSVAQFGLENPRLSITVFTGKEESRQSLLFGGKVPGEGKDGIYVRRGERTPVYTVHHWVFADTNKSLNDLRDKTVFGFEPSQLGKLKLTGAGKSFSIERGAKGGWQLSDGAKSDADVPVVERFIDQLRDLKGQSIVEDPMSDAKKFGLDAPAQEVELSSKDGKGLGWVKLARIERNDDNAPSAAPKRVDYYAVSSASHAVFKINDFNFDQLNKTQEQFRAKPLAAPAAGPTAAKK